MKSNSAVSDVLTEKVAICFNMFSALMIDIIMHNINSTFIVSVKRGSTGMRNIHVTEKPAKPNDFLDSISDHTIFIFST